MPENAAIHAEIAATRTDLDRVWSERELLATIEDLVSQFAYAIGVNGTPALWTGGLSALEGAFQALGWDDPHPLPEMACEAPGCPEWATTGAPTPDGYQRLCGAHFRALDEARREADHA